MIFQTSGRGSINALAIPVVANVATFPPLMLGKLIAIMLGEDNTGAAIQSPAFGLLIASFSPMLFLEGLMVRGAINGNGGIQQVLTSFSAPDFIIKTPGISITFNVGNNLANVYVMYVC